MLAETQVNAYAEKMRRVLAGADEFPGYWSRLQQRWAAQANHPEHCAAKLRRAYEEMNGSQIGCD